MTGGQLNADIDQYLQANAMNTPPPLITSDPLVTGATPIEQLLRVLGLAANLGDARDNADSAEEHALRDAGTAEAAEKFAAQDQQAARDLAGVAEWADPGATPANTTPDTAQTAAISQQLPQAASSIAGAVSGALGGALQPLAQIPQQIAQGTQQAMQAGMGLFQQAAGSGADTDLESSLLGEFESAPEDFDALGDQFGDGDIGGLASGAGPGFGGVGGGLLGGTAPTSTLGPPPIPSAGTAPSSSPISPIAPPSPPSAAAGTGAGMAGMPIVPPGAMAGANNAEKDAKADTRRVSVPPVRNGAPVQGRLNTPPAAPRRCAR